MDGDCDNCAGMMLAASIVGLVAPAVTMASLSGWWQVVAGVAAVQQDACANETASGIHQPKAPATCLR